MATFSKNKWLTALVILLVVINAVTIVLFWMGRDQQQPPSRPPHAQGGPANYLIRELQLDGQQQQQYLQLVNVHRQAADQLREQIGEKKDSLFHLLRQNPVPDSVKKAAVAAAGRLSEELDLLTFDHFQKVRALCTPAQQEKFDRIIREVIAMMGGPRPEGPGGPPHGKTPPDSLPAGPLKKTKNTQNDRPGQRDHFPGGPPPGGHGDRPPPPGDFPPDHPPPHRPPPDGPPPGRPGEHPPPPPHE